MLQVSQCSLYLSDTFTLSDLNFCINEGQQVAIIGESGCGKTSLLKLIYGLMDADEGTLIWKDQPIQGPKYNLVPGMSFIKYLSQDFDLMPYTSVEENIKKFLSRFYPEKSTQRTLELLDVVELSAFAKAKVKTLSGGQKQRVALAQVLAKEPELLLLDEPFSHIDNFRKNKLRRRLFNYLRAKKITCIMATHDATDVLSYMDETIVMRNGFILTKNSTQELYRNPLSYYVASLFGDVNELPAHWFNKAAPQKQMLLVYPHQLKISSSKNQCIAVVVIASYYMGSHYLIDTQYQSYSILFFSDKPFKNEEQVYLSLKE